MAKNSFVAEVTFKLKYFWRNHFGGEVGIRIKGNVDNDPGKDSMRRILKYSREKVTNHKSVTFITLRCCKKEF